MRVALFSTQTYDQEYFEKINSEFGHELVYFKPSLNGQTVSLCKGFPAICTFVNDQLKAEVLQQLFDNGVKIVALRCAGFNQVDLPKAAELGIQIVRVPAYSPQSVAEHAVALIMTLNRKTHKAYNRVREGNFSLDKLTGFDVFGKTVGVIGTGKIGAAFCRIMIGFGCKVIAFDPFPDENLKKTGVNYVLSDTLFKESDIISLHCPLTPQTHHIINKSSIKMMKEQVMLINTSRGGLVDTKAVIKALKSKKIAYLGIDVYEQEENLFFKDLSETVIEDDTIMRLMTFPNVLITAHQAFFTDNALNQIAHTTLQNLKDFEDGKELVNAITK